MKRFVCSLVFACFAASVLIAQNTTPTTPTVSFPLSPLDAGKVGLRTGFTGSDFLLKLVGTTVQFRDGTDNSNISVQAQNGVFLGSITKVNNIATSSGNYGVPANVAYNRVSAVTTAQTNFLNYAGPAADATYQVACNVNVTTSTSYSFNVVLGFTDETNTARTFNLTFQLAGFITTLSNADGAQKFYLGVPVNFRAKASTNITVSTSGTFTTVTYNSECSLFATE